jgi:hypothetical protein
MHNQSPKIKTKNDESNELKEKSSKPIMLRKINTKTMLDEDNQIKIANGKETIWITLNQ